jgi:hypothetical protein
VRARRRLRDAASRSALPLALLATAVATGARFLSAAPIVPAAEAGRHAGSTVTVEGDVADARIENGALVLDLAAGDPKGFRVVLVLSLVNDLPRHPERIYAGKRVRASGMVQRFQGRPEMVLETASQIEVVDVAEAAPPPTTSTAAPPAAPRAAAPLPAAPPPPPAPAPSAAAAALQPAAPPPPAAPSQPAPAATPPSTAAPAETPPLLSERLAAAACERAQRHWHDAADTVRDRSAALDSCLAATPYQCRAAAAALAPALADLEWAEQQVATRCD